MKSIRSIVTFFSIIAIFLLIYLVYTFFTDGEGSYWLFGAREGGAWVYTWLDNNANGIQDSGERPFVNVCIWADFNYKTEIPKFEDSCEGPHLYTTDDQGNWEEFLPNESCESFYVYARIPVGFQPTTDLASNGCDAKFGFAPNGVQVKQRVQSGEKFFQKQMLLLSVKRIAIGLSILLVAIFSTIWLQKTCKLFFTNNFKDKKG